MRDLTLVFDLDGTLVDTAPDLIASTNHVLDHLGLPHVDAQTLRPFVGHGAKHMIERAVGPAAERLTAAEHDDLLRRYLSYYGEHIAVGSRPFEGVLPLLEAFKAEGVKLAVCTNKMERMSRLLLDTLDMSRFFAAVAGRDTLPVAKPHPDALLGTIRLAGGDRSRAIMIGDSGVDVATAKAAGVPVIGVTFGYTEAPVREFAPDAVIDHYRELEPAIAALLALSSVHGTR
jgi:phosphoglycolate phosphatase